MDSSEIVIFESLARNWYGKMMAPLRRMNGLRIPAIVEGLESTGAIKLEHLGSEKLLKGLTILDVGCGGGFASEPLAKLGAEVVGIDGVPLLIEVARRHAVEDKELTNLTYIASSLEEFNSKCDQQFDVVLAFEILDHVAHHQKFLDATVKFLKPGGSLFLSTMDRSWTSWIYCKILPEYVFKWIPLGTHQYCKFITAVEVQKILESYNFETKSVKGYYYNFLRQYWYWEKTTSRWYFIHSVKKEIKI